MSMKFKLILVAVSVALSMGILTLLTYHAMTKTQTLTHGDRMISTIEVDMLTLRRHEKDFLSRKEVKYIDSFNAVSTQMSKHLKELSGIFSGANIETNLIKRLETALSTYTALFQEIVSLQQSIGLDEKSGLSGHLREAAHMAEKGINEAGDVHLLADILMLRRNEKDFMLRKDLKYLDKFNNNIGVLMDTLSASMLNMAVEQHIHKEIGYYQQDFQALVAASQTMGLTPQQGKLGEMRNTVHQTEASLEELNEKMHAVLADATSALLTMTIGISLAISVLLVLAILGISRSIGKRLDTLNNRLQDIAKGEGDLTKILDASGKDEFAQVARSFNIFVEKIRGVIGEVSTTTDGLASTAAQGMAVAEQSRQRMQLEQSDIDQVATAMNEMVATVQEVARNALSAAEAAQQAKRASELGDQVTNSTGETIYALVDEVKTAATVVKELEADSDNIGAILDAIRTIADQTNLLALNAAIEAARAGESGRGFAVVADEVRTLAQRTQGSIEEIQRIIERLQTNVTNASRTMQAGMKRADTGVQEVAQTKQAIAEINQAVNRISDMNTQIASAAEEQSTVTEEVNRNVVSIAGVANETAQDAEEAARANEALSGMTTQLQRLVAQFII